MGLAYVDELSFVLGNHDVWGGSNAFTVGIRGKWKKRKAARLLFSQYPGRFEFGGARQPYVDLFGTRIRGYLLDSTATGITNFMACGCVTLDELKRLEAMVESDAATDRGMGISSCLRIAVLHHPIRSIEGHSRTMILTNSAEVLDCMHRLEFGIVLCGHEHRRVQSSLGQGLWQFVGGSATQHTSDENEFAVYDIRNSRGTLRVGVTGFSRPSGELNAFSAQSYPEVQPRTATL